MTGATATVSVPLRGYGFEMRGRERNSFAVMSVSVPLRGYGFEIMNAVTEPSP